MIYSMEELNELFKSKDSNEFTEDEMLLWQYYIYKTYFENPFETEVDYPRECWDRVGSRTVAALPAG